MRKFESAEFLSLLKAIDAELKKPCRVVLIGGAVISLVYRVRHATSDLDVIEAERHFWTAYENALKKDKENLPPVQRVGIAEPPYNYEDRLQKLDSKSLKRLKVFVPERHDFVILKAARGYAHDLDAIEEVHRKAALDMDTLIERYEETRSQIIGSPARFRGNILAVVARLWGDEAAEELDATLA